MHADFMMGLGLLGVTYRLRPVTFWDLEEHDFVGQFTRSTNSYSTEPYIHAFLFNPNPEINLAAVSYQDGSTHVFDPEIQKTQAIAQTDASVLAASPDGTVLAVGSGNGFIKLYDFETMKLLHQTFLSERAIRAITFNSSGQRLFEVRSNSCNIWEPSALVRRIDNTNDDSSIDISDRVSQAAPTSIAKTIDDEKAITALVPHHSGDYIFCGRENGSVAVYSAKSGKMSQELFNDSKNVAVDFLDWNRSRDLLTVADRSGQVFARTVVKDNTSPFTSNELSLSLKCRGVIEQILVKTGGEELLISTADSLEVWDLASASMVKRYDFVQPSLPRRFANHPDAQTIICFEGTSCRLCTWATIDDLVAQEHSATESLTIVSPKWTVTRAIIAEPCRYVCVAAGSDVSAGTTKRSLYFQLVPIKAFDLSTTATPYPPTTLHAIKDLKVIVGTYKSWLIYLQHSGWVCSINLDTATNDKFYLRHFLVPMHWHGINVGPMAVTPKGNVIMAVEDEIAVFNNGLDFEEKVLLA